MTYLIMGLVILAGWHFVYESILAPSLRLSIRFELFALRDELRKLKLSHGSGLDEKHYSFLQDSLNSMIAMLHRYDLMTVSQVDREFSRNSEFRKRCEARAKVLDDCQIPEAKAIRKRSVKIAVKAFAVNSGGWAAYLLPFVIGQIGYASLKSKLRMSISLSESDIERVAPDGSANASFA